MKKNIFILLIPCLVACGGKKVGSFKVDNSSTGKAAEVILIINNNYYTDSVAKIILEPLTQPQPAINQIEPLFDIIQFENKDFSSHFKRHRNIVHFNIDTAYLYNTFTIETDKWANPQVYVQIKGNRLDSCLALYVENKEKIVHLLYENDLKRLHYYFLQNEDKQVQKKIQQLFNINLKISNHYIIAKEEEDFLWLRFRTVKNDRFVIIYKTPNVSLQEDSLIAMRNHFTKKYIPGAVAGAYPIVAEKLGFPIVQSTVINGKSGVEMRGLWESVNDKMGGPFYSFTFQNKLGEYVTVDGFVYAPQEEKRDYIREVESIVKSVR
jgi:hypothetical protein